MHIPLHAIRTKCSSQYLKSMIVAPKRREELEDLAKPHV